MSLGSGISSANYGATDIQALPSKYKIASTSTVFEMIPVKQNKRLSFISMTFHQLITHRIISFLNISLKKYEVTLICFQWKTENKIRNGFRASQAHQIRKGDRYKVLEELLTREIYWMYLSRFWQRGGCRRAGVERSEWLPHTAGSSKLCNRPTGHS